MQFKNQWFGEAFATSAYPLDSREETNLETLGGARSRIEGSSFAADADTAAADLVVATGGMRKSTAPPEIRLEVVSAPQVPSLRSQYVIGVLGICLVFAPVLEALGTHINLGLSLRISGIFAVALTVAAAVQIEEWMMCAQIALGLGLFGLGCFGPTDTIVDIFLCCVFGFLIAFLAAMQAENFKAARAWRDDLGRRKHSPAGDKLAQIDGDETSSATESRRATQSSCSTSRLICAISSLSETPSPCR
jgi:hypothetical protein